MTLGVFLIFAYYDIHEISKKELSDRTLGLHDVCCSATTINKPVI